MPLLSINFMTLGGFRVFSGVIIPVASKVLYMLKLPSLIKSLDKTDVSKHEMQLMQLHKS